MERCVAQRWKGLTGLRGEVRGGQIRRVAGPAGQRGRMGFILSAKSRHGEF